MLNCCVAYIRLNILYFALTINVRKVEWKNLVVSLTDTHNLRVQDILNETMGKLDFRDKGIYPCTIAYSEQIECPYSK